MYAECKDIETKPATYHEMIYFTVVTLSTVGFGDIVPKTENGRISVILLIIIVIILIPKLINELIRLMGKIIYYYYFKK